MQNDTPDAELRRHYRRILTGHWPEAPVECLEAMPADGEATDGGPCDTDVEDGYEPPPLDLSDEAIRDRVQTSRVTLLDVVDRHLGGGEDLRRIVYRLLDEERCVRALGALRDDDDGQGEWDEDADEQLEAIVLTNGRPSFMVRHGEIDRTTSPTEGWEQHLDKSGKRLTTALGCVGRIDDPDQMNGFAGTGFLVQENLIVTNRHVVQSIAAQHDDGSWSLKPGLRIDFGHEFNAQASLRPRVLDRVVFAGSQPILPRRLDHTRLDLALIALVRADNGNRPPTVLSINTSPDWAKEIVYVVGYPAAPPLGYATSLLQQLFRETYGCKRVAPGHVMPASSPTVLAWQLAHDATTLGGSSGSAILMAGNEGASVAVHYAGKAHYAGKPTSPSENWAHKLGLALDESDGLEKGAKTLREHLHDHHVTLTGRYAFR